MASFEDNELRAGKVLIVRNYLNPYAQVEGVPVWNFESYGYVGQLKINELITVIDILSSAPEPQPIQRIVVLCRLGMVLIDIENIACLQL